MRSPLVQQKSSTESFREAMAHVCTPVAVVTTFAGGRAHGTTVSAFMSLSMCPPMVAVALDNDSELLALIRTSNRFGINVLSSSQSELALTFAGKGRPRFADVGWSRRDNLPSLDGVSGWVACAASDFTAGGDHTMVSGVVISAAYEALEPLTYHRRIFGTHQEHP